MGGDAEGISDAVFEFATVANDNLLTAREMLKETGGDGGQVPQVAMPVFLYGVRRSQRLRWASRVAPARSSRVARAEGYGVLTDKVNS